ncbi:hypothetical protein DYB35_007446 [Aphanomyces astaci]|uniref:Protein kinase domain-containing protein n=1 Tax=Aphanomyces astaci TaxID=112090 RepID=A0A3R7AT41_APHAT|nr:hypothetical protein DYB35_007446 [Aphanomyces astaci]
MDDDGTATTTTNPPPAVNVNSVCQAAYAPFIQRYPTCAFTSLLAQSQVNATSVRSSDCLPLSQCRVGLTAFVAAFQPQLPTNLLAKCLLTDTPTKLTTPVASLNALCLGEIPPTSPPPPPPPPLPSFVLPSSVTPSTTTPTSPPTSTKPYTSYTSVVQVIDPSWVASSSVKPLVSPGDGSVTPAREPIEADDPNHNVAAAALIICAILLAVVVVFGVVCLVRKAVRRQRRVEEYSSMQDLTATEMMLLERRREQATSSVTTTMDHPPPPPPHPLHPTPYFTSTMNHGGGGGGNSFVLDSYDLMTPNSRSSHHAPALSSGTPKQQQQPRRSFPPPSPLPYDDDVADLAKYSISAADVRLLQPLAQGLSREVWLAQNSQDKTMITATRLLPHMKTPYELHVFVRSIHLLARMQCPEYIVHFVGVTGVLGRKPTDMMLLTEYMDCGDLRGILDTNHADSSFHWSHKLQCAAHIALGLAYLHAKSLVHGNLSSLNVLVDSANGAKLSYINGSCNPPDGDDDDVVRLRRFGRSRGSNLKLLTAGLGAFRWVAPEVLRGNQPTPAADMYSLGVILSELDTEQMPFSSSASLEGVVTPRRLREGDHANQEVLVSIVTNAASPAFSPTCPSWFLSVATTCVDADPTRRPTATIVANRFQSQLATTIVYDSARN